MPDIRIDRAHGLGLTRARKLAWQWAEQVEAEFEMECTVYEGEDSDTVRFERPGVQGELLVTAERFELQASLGFLLGAFSDTIRSEIEQRLDALLLVEAKRPSGRTASKTARKKPSDGKP